MEQEKDDDIGQLFRSSFEGHKLVPEREEWEMLQSSMQRLNFFKFNALQFNIYYASTILFCFLTCLGVGSHYMYTQVLKPQSQLQSSSIVTEPNSANEKDQIQNEGRSSTPGNSENGFSSVDASNNERPNSREASNPNKTDQNSYQKNEGDKANTLTDISINHTPGPEDPNSGPLVKSIEKTDSSHVNLKHQKDISGDDSSRIKKRTLYITKQDTIYKYDTLRAPKPKRRRF